jgi:hypothetical protein
MRWRLTEYVCPRRAEEARRRRVTLIVDACLVGAATQLAIAAVRLAAGDRSFRVGVLVA